MPNWCSNYISVRGTNQAEIKRLADAFDSGELLQSVIPVPEDLLVDGATTSGGPNAAVYDQIRADNKTQHGYDNWYDFCVARWGTKWDISSQEECHRDEDGLGFSGGFDTAWSPPMGVVEQMVENGLEVTLHYNEPGMAFVGKFEDGEDHCYDYGSCDSETVRGYIGDELDDFWGISEQMAEYESENEEEDVHRWVREGGEKLGLVNG